MAKANKRNKSVSKKDQKKLDVENGLFIETAFSKTTDDVNLTIVHEQNEAKESEVKNGRIYLDESNEKSELGEGKVLPEHVDTSEVNDVKSDSEFTTIDNSSEEEGRSSQEMGYESGQVVTWAHPTVSLHSSEVDQTEKQSSQMNTVEEESRLANPVSNVPAKDEKPQAVVKFDIRKPVYLEIHNGNIFHYFSSGIVSPSKYITNRAFPDLQTINKDFLVLVNSPSHSSYVDHILLEVDLEGIDIDTILIQENFALLEAPFPVSKIKSILVQELIIKDSIVNDALVFNGGFIPENLIIVQKLKNQQRFDIKIIRREQVRDYSAKIDKFDRILGLLAFVRNYDLLISGKSKIYKTLPNHFFYAMQVLDESFGTEIVPKNIISEFYSYLFNDSCPPEKELLKWIFSRVNSNDNFTDEDKLNFGKLLNIVNEDSESLRKNILTLLSKNLERKKALKLIDESKSKSQLQLYVFAFLRNYGNLNNIDISRRDIESVYSNNFGEYAFAVLGYFYGYKNLKNTEERISLTESISNFIPLKPPIKFSLTTRFDYIILELVYQFVFSGKENKLKFPVRIPENLVDEKPVMKRAQNNYRTVETVLYGKLYQNISFYDPFDIILEELSKLPEEIPLISDLGVFCHKVRIGIKPIMISDISHAGSIFERACFSKADLYRYLLDHRNNIDVEEIQLRLQLFKKINAK